MLDDTARILAAFALVVLNGFFVLAEFALVKVRSTRLEELVEAGGKLAPKAKEALHVVSRLDDYLSATQLGITLASLALGWIGEPAFAGIFERVFAAGGFMSSAAAHGASATAAFLLISGIHIIVGELTFKSIAIQHAERSALFVARPLRIFHRIFAIPLTLMNGASRAVLRLIRIKPASEVEVTYTEEELRSILGASQERGGFSFHHLLLLENAFDFGELRLKDVMVPLESTTCLDASRPWTENAAVIAQKRLSRYPLVDGPKGKVIGLVHVKTILMDLLAGRTPDLRRDMIKMPRAPQELLLEAALRKLQKSGEHMGIAVNEEGVPVGMFTLEDIVEELIGDISDEYDDPDTELGHVDEVDGLTTIEEFAELTGYVIPEGPYDTVAGFFMAETGVLPELGARVVVVLRPERGDEDAAVALITLEVTQLDGRRAAWFRLEIGHAGQEDPDG